MTQGTADRVKFNSAAQTTLRVLIASYFIAVTLKLIPGTNLGLLFSSVLSEPYSSATAAGIVFVFAFMIMIGLATRLAALMIALLTFFASYLTMVELGVAEELGAFWRDLALIAALLLTYGEPERGSYRSRKLLHREIVPRRVQSIVARSNAEAEDNVDMRAIRRGAAARCARPEPVTQAPAPEPAQLVFISRRRPTAPAAAIVTDTGFDPVENIFDDGLMSA